jgi:hypothetical protein
MRKADAVSFFGSQQALANKFELSRSTVSEWPDPIPLGWAYLIELLSKKRCPVDLSLYPKVPKELLRPARTR